MWKKEFVLYKVLDCSLGDDKYTQFKKKARLNRLYIPFPDPDTSQKPETSPEWERVQGV